MSSKALARISTMITDVTEGSLDSEGDEMPGTDFVSLVTELLTALKISLVSNKITAIAFTLSFSKVTSVSEDDTTLLTGAKATIDKQSEAVDLSLAGLQKAFLTLTGMEASEEQIGAAGGQEIQLGAVQVMVGHEKISAVDTYLQDIRVITESKDLLSEVMLHIEDIISGASSAEETTTPTATTTPTTTGTNTTAA